MPGFNKRHIQRRSIQIFKTTGKVIRCYQRLSSSLPDEVATRVPADLYTAQNRPTEGPTTTKMYYIFGKFDEDDKEEEGPEGRISEITGIIVVPVMYQAKLMQTDYFDPYLNGSRFEKVGKALVDEEGLFITQPVVGVIIPQLGEVQA